MLVLHGFSRVCPYPYGEGRDENVKSEIKMTRLSFLTLAKLKLQSVS